MKDSEKRGWKPLPRHWKAIFIVMAALLAWTLATFAYEYTHQEPSYRSEDPELLSEGPGSCRYFWNTHDFSGLDYEKRYDSGLTVSHRVSVEDGCMKYEGAGRKDGDLLRTNEVAMGYSQYWELMEILSEAECDMEGDMWTLSYRMDGRDRVLSGCYRNGEGIGTIDAFLARLEAGTSE